MTDTTPQPPAPTAEDADSRFIAALVKRWSSPKYNGVMMPGTSKTCDVVAAILDRKLLARPDGDGEPVARQLTVDEKAAVEFYTLNPTAALFDLRQRIDAKPDGEAVRQIVAWLRSPIRSIKPTGSMGAHTFEDIARAIERGDFASPGKEGA